MNPNNRVKLLALCAAGLLAGCAPAPNAEHQDIRPVRTMLAGRSNGTVGATYSGEIRARYENALAFRTGGKVVARLVEVGSHVKRGQPLLQLDAEQESLQLAASGADTDAARSRVDQAKVDVARAEMLVGRQFASQAELDHQRLALRQAEAQLRSATARQQVNANTRGFTTLVANRDGVVSAIQAETGQVVGAGQPVVTLAADGEREVSISIPESRVEELRRAGELKVTVWAHPGLSWSGKLRELAPDTDSVTRSYSARVAIADADQQELRLGMTASVFAPDVDGKSGIRVPLTAVVDKGGKRSVWVVDPGSLRVSTREVELGSAQNDSVLVTSGLAGGETVVTAGVHMLQPKQQVRLAGGGQ